MKSNMMISAFCWVAGLFLLIGALPACQRNREAIVRVDLGTDDSYLEGETMYLGNRETKAFVDSAVVRNGKFEFRLQSERRFVPFEASILHATGDPAWLYQVIGFRNPFFKRTFESDFYPEAGITSLSLDTMRIGGGGRKITSLKFAQINRQTAVAFRHYAFKENPENAPDIRDYNRALIQKHPYSIELLRLFNFNKSALDEEEAKHMLSLFEPELQADPVYEVVTSFLSYKNTTGSDFPANVKVRAADEKLSDKILLDASKHNLVVFWASWCGPCRMEIPQIKKLHEGYGDKLNIVSVSVDKDEAAWRKALAKEAMPWGQFLLPGGESFAMLDKKYSLSSIPVWVLVDKKGKLIEKHVGYATGEQAVDQRVAQLLK